MRYRTTAKEVKEGYARVIAVGYCDLQTLLNYRSPIAYAAGTYGWNFDVYDFGHIAIVTGYRGMPSKRSSAPYDLVRKYENLSQGKTEAERETLIAAFIKEATQ